MSNTTYFYVKYFAVIQGRSPLEVFIKASKAALFLVFPFSLFYFFLCPSFSFFFLLLLSPSPFSFLLLLFLFLLAALLNYSRLYNSCLVHQSLSFRVS